MTKAEKTTIILSFSPKAMNLLEEMAKANKEPSAKAYVLSVIQSRVESDLEFFHADYVDGLFSGSEEEQEARS